METRTLELRRQVQRARYRHAWWMALCAGVSANALLAMALWMTAPRPEAPAAVVVEAVAAPAPAAAPVIVPTPPLVVVVPPAPVAVEPFGDLGPCPAPHRAMPRGALVDPPASYDLVGLAASPTDSRLVAVWSTDDIFVTRDGGRSWAQVLDGAAGVVDVSFDCHGRVLALRAGVGLGIRDGAREAWRPVAGIGWGVRHEADPSVEVDDTDTRYEPRLVGGGRLIAVIGAPSSEGEARAALSADAGATWWSADLGWYEGDLPRAIWRGDTLDVMVRWTDCMSEGVRRVIVDETGTHHSELGTYGREMAFDGERIHLLGWTCPERDDALDATFELCTLRGGRWTHQPIDRRRLSGLVEGADPMLIDGPMDVVVFGDQVAVMRGGRLGRWRAWDADGVPSAADLAGRVWGLDRGAVFRR